MANFLLIHGACHGAWCWDAVAVSLKAKGHRVMAPDLPCDDASAGLEEYAQTCLDLLNGSVDGELIIVGHSLGALTASVVAARVRCMRLVFVAGIIGAPGKSLADLAETDADRDGQLDEGEIEFEGHGMFRFTAAGAHRTLFHDCLQSEAEAAISRLRFQQSMWNEVAPFDDWPDTEIVSVLCLEDRIVNPPWTRRVSRERLGIVPIEIMAGHSPWLSQPDRLADVLLEGLPAKASST